MSELENKLLNILIDLKTNYNVSGVKAEFGEEGISFEEAIFLKKIATKVGLNFVLKIGGCEALRDIIDAKKIGVNTIVAPMIESEYALKKFIKAANIAFENNMPESPKLGINIETITGLNNITSILSCTEASNIETIVLGRSDMALSLGKSRDYVNSDEMYDIALKIANIAHKLKKKITIGGNASADSVEFIDRLFPQHIDKFETRKIVFDINSIDKKSLAEGINMALDFELNWLYFKKEFFNNFTKEDANRINLLKQKLYSLQN